MERNEKILACISQKLSKGGFRQLGAPQIRLSRNTTPPSPIPPSPPTPTCEESSSYTISNVSYPSYVISTQTSITVSFTYKLVITKANCDTMVINDSDSYVVQFGQNMSDTPRVISGTFNYHNTTISYSFTQEGTTQDNRIVAVFNVSDNTLPTHLATHGENINRMEIDGIDQGGIIANYPFSTLGEHIVKYSLKDSTIIENDLFSDCKEMVSAVIPNSVTHIESDAFERCYGLTSVTIPNSVISLGGGAFYECSGLTNVNIPPHIEAIGGHTFRGCRNITHFDLPNGIKSIGFEAFYDCKAITNIEIPSSVVTIESQVYLNGYKQP